MVLLEIDAQRVAFLELEGDAPGSVDVNGVPERTAPEGVEIKTRNVHVLGDPCMIESIEAPQTTLVEHLLDAPSCSGVEQLLQAFVPEAPNHAGM
jgi:hypothetical protein